LLAIPTFGLLVFTILPMIFMVLIAFTNWDAYHYPPKELFTWVAFDNFVDLFGGGVSTDSKLFFYTFKQVLLWTFMWAIFATFTNYFLGMIVAMLINKKGIKFKKLWRSILVFTIAVPQFVSLLLISQMLQDNGVINVMLEELGWISSPIPFMSNKIMAKITVIIVNIWVGIPYTMLICTGILMNIPDDLYESAKIDGASPVRMYFKITLPYMLFVTGPYLLSQFIGNINNFNVIYLLSGGAPNNLNYQFAGETDLLITWLYKLTLNNTNYKMAAVIGIVVFIIIAVISLPFYSKTNAVNNEEDFR
jgi:arabinogalactan oligomer/maltooligosaccharide transport system permease protein